MVMSPDNNLEGICTVTEIAKKLGLSRARFYQLQKMGVFPKPVYCPRTNRPFYTLDLQQKCIDIRKTGFALNGQPVIFYTLRKNSATKPQNQSNHKIQELTDILKQMGLNVTHRKIQKAVNELYPEGLAEGPVENAIITDLFKHLCQRCKKGV